MFYVKLVKQYLTQNGGDALGTDAQNRIVEVARNSAKYGISAVGGYCEAWVEEVYRKAGVSIDQHCCAGKNRALYTVGKSSKNIPLGAMVYNDPAVYQSRTNDTCGRNAGHVGIYIGNGQIISNIGGTAIDTVEGWTATMASAAGAGAALWLHTNKAKEIELCFRKRQKSSRNRRNCVSTRRNSRKPAVIAMWLLFVCGFAFAVYKNLLRLIPIRFTKRRLLSTVWRIPVV